ncbi:plasminogen activator inhibitor 1 [Bicyclus anynana]|uniref:Plasminogen activator inhibitor 1-like n=1 Tax=Bicyclus anynana TaxID=110368 RepID=A0A6J1MR88_BICAN|nr:plasminogen activator inhibitor 1 [Bicyclus anynana]XP_023935377.1 plasminogen activator inhibitor 1 [Bicyclus anynana]
MTSTLFTGITVYALCLLVISSTVQGDDPVGDPTVDTATSQDNKKEDALANSINDFGFNLLTKMLADNDDKNIIISPTGIAGLLSMALLGSVGKTYDELANMLGFSQDVRINRANHEMFGDLLKALNDNTTTSRTMFADAVFVDDDSKLRPEYRSYLERVYNGEAVQVDFTDKETVKNLINEWVSNQTSDKISNFLKDTLPVNTKAVLLSALYFSGQWKHPFTPEFTMRLPFKKPKGEIMVDLMLNAGKFNTVHSAEHELRMVALPYNDSTTTMYLIKPRNPEQMSLPELLNRLNYTTINKLIDNLRKNTCLIRLPKMDLQYNANLVNPLKAMGLSSIFIPGQANFALMIEDVNLNKTDELVTRINSEDEKNLKDIIAALPDPGVHIDEIIHDVKITIDEYGTEAVAATGGFLARSADLFYADSPFYMFIRNEKTKLVTFSAAIFDPLS